LALDPETVSPGQRKLVIVLPVDSPSPDLCKVISSAVALGYPAPVLVNWKKDFRTDEEGVGPSHLGKVTGTLSFLEWATGPDVGDTDRLDDNDIILMLDAHDVWLQLPPQVMVHRYFKSIQQANLRLAQEGGFLANDSVNQTTIASAQKGCFAPRDPLSDLHCDQLPESTLAPDVYGFWTDSKVFNWNSLRPRYVNSGSFMGPAGDMKRYFGRVRDKMDKHMHMLMDDQALGGDQGIFSETFAEQELWRKRLRANHAAGDEKGVEKTLKWHGTYEYHVGLDYTQELFYPTCYAESDGFFVTLGEENAVKTESARLGVSPPRVAGVPDDIKEVESPLAVLDGIDEKKGSWGQLPLYADFWTTAVPVAVHHNAWKKGLKSRRVSWWDKTWYFPYLRRLIAAHSVPINETSPLATIPAQSGGTLEISPYDAERTQRSALIFGRKSETEGWKLHEAEWEGVCKSDDGAELEHSWFDEVFRDGNGPLNSRRHEPLMTT
jgi:hypothetical protein